jgi:hypothetical protein
MKCLTLIAMLLFSLASLASELNGRRYKWEYESGNHYLISLDTNSITWTGTQGTDLGRTGTDPYQYFKLAPHTFMIQWTENDGTFVTVVINENKKTVWSSGQFNGKSWFRKGVIK